MIKTDDMSDEVSIFDKDKDENPIDLVIPIKENDGLRLKKNGV